MLKIWTIVLLGVGIFFGNNIEARAITKELGFELSQASNSTVEIGRERTYDYAPSVIEENGSKKIYVCGGGQPGDKYAGHDAIYLTEYKDGVKTIDSKRVISPLLDTDSDDALHACAPTVFKNSFSQLEGGKEKYLMYYECAPLSYAKGTTRQINQFTQICLAFSDDGVNWKKYNEKIWSSEFRFANENEPATAVVRLNPYLQQVLGFEVINNKYYVTNETVDINYYGVGHPSAFVKDGKIWLFYYDSVGDWSKRSVVLTYSNDGFHFINNTKITDLKSPFDIRYINAKFGDKNGVFVSIMGFGKLGYNYSWDGISWAWKEEDRVEFYEDFLTKNYVLNYSPSGSRCFIAGTSSMAGDKYGIVNSATNIEFWTNVGYRGIDDGCTSTNGCTCYLAAENESRGTTWQTVNFVGNFKLIKSGDANGDGKTDLNDFGIWKKEYLGQLTTKTADFNGDGKIGLDDFGIWKKVYVGVI